MNERLGDETWLLATGAASPPSGLKIAPTTYMPASSLPAATFVVPSGHGASGSFSFVDDTNDILHPVHCTCHATAPLCWLPSALSMGSHEGAVKARQSRACRRGLG